MTYEEFRKAYPATRCFQRYTSEQRATIRSSHRAGHRQREAVGEFYYVHEMVPGVGFPTAKAATQRAHENYMASRKRIEPQRVRIEVEDTDAGVELEAEAEAEAMVSVRGGC